MDQAMADTRLLAQARGSFPALERWTYLDLGGRDVLSREVRAALDAHLDERMFNGADKDRFFAMTEEARGKFARLINADADEIAYTKNISDGLNMVATGLEWRPGDNVILCGELEHPNNVYPWLNQRARGLEARFVKHRDGHMPVDDMIACIDDGTRVVTCSTVSFSPGFRTDIDRLGRACRERGVLFLVDAAQSAGVLHTDVRAASIDALSVSTQKGLLGLYGMGYLYVRREWAQRMRPAYLARFGVDLGRADVHESDIGDQTYDLMPAARRFDLGNYNYIAVAAADAAMKFLLELDTRNIEPYVVRTAHALANGLRDLGFPVCGGAPGPHLAHIVCVGVYGSGGDKGGSDERMNRFYQFLVENRVKLSMRRGVLRLSLHVYNNMDDVARVLDLAKQFIAADKRR
jgi:selenocysteine lyase/cysteine desulfurase